MIRQLGVLLLLASLPAMVTAGEEKEKTAKAGSAVAVPASPYALILEPKFMGAKQFVLLPDSKETGFVPAKWDGKELNSYTKAEFRALEMPWKKFFAKASGETAGKLVDELKAKFYRDEKEIITHAVIESANPLLASVIVSPAFRKKFSAELGTEFFVAVPNRKAMVLFPKTGGNLIEMSKEVEYLFEIATHPVSLELIEIKKDGIGVVGKFGAK